MCELLGIKKQTYWDHGVHEEENFPPVSTDRATSLLVVDALRAGGHFVHISFPPGEGYENDNWVTVDTVVRDCTEPLAEAICLAAIAALGPGYAAALDRVAAKIPELEREIEEDGL